MYAVLVDRVIKVCTQHHFLPVPLQALAGSRARRGVSHYKAAKEVIRNQ